MTSPNDEPKVLEFKGVKMAFDQFPKGKLITTDYDWTENEANLAKPEDDLEPAAELAGAVLEYKPREPKSAEALLRESHDWKIHTPEPTGAVVFCTRCGITVDGFFLKPRPCAPASTGAE